MKKKVIERTMFYGAKAVIFERAKSLRENMTFAERKLWNEFKIKQNKCIQI